MIPPKQNGCFVAQMELVLDIYKRPYDPRYPVVCMDESPKQLIGETKIPIPASPGQLERYDYEYRRLGMCNVFLAFEPLAGKRLVRITERKKGEDWAYFLKRSPRSMKALKRLFWLWTILKHIFQALFILLSHQKRQDHYGKDLNLFILQNTEAG